MDPGRGQLRVWRGLVLAAACLALPTAAHAAAGGGVPVHGPFLFGAALLCMACVGLADRQRAPRTIAAVIALTQPPMHVVLALSSHGPASIVPTPGMVLAHGAAALALTAVLAGGEAVVWSLAALAATVLGSTARSLLTWSPDARLVPVGHLAPVDLPRPPHLILAAKTLRRGPPPVVSGT